MFKFVKKASLYFTNFINIYYLGKSGTEITFDNGLLNFALEGILVKSSSKISVK
jgi:hypothetical protein